MTRKRVVPFSVVQECRYQRERFGKSYAQLAAFYDLNMWTIRSWCEYETRLTR